MLRNFFTLFLMISFFTGTAQDLIELTQLGRYTSTTQPPNEIAKTLQTKKQLATSRTTNSYDLFKIGDQRQAYSRNVQKGVALHLQKETLQTIRKQAHSLLNLRIPVNASNAFELELYQIDIHADGFQVTTSAPVNQTIKHTGIFYTGIVKGNPNSSVAVSLFEDQVVVYLQDRRGNYKIAKNEAGDNYLLYNGADRTDIQRLKCDVNSSSYEIANVQKATTRSVPRNSNLPDIDVYIEVDNAFYVDKNSDVNEVITYIESMVTQAIVIYATIGVPIKMSALKIHTTTDGYANGADDTGVKLDAFASMLQDNYVGRVAHLITGEVGGGVAQLDIFCKTYAEHEGAGPFALTGIGELDEETPSLNDLNTFVHELGHNFGSLHTQGCFWNGNYTPLDGCVDPESYDENDVSCSKPTPNCPLGFGTIMSYCDAGDPDCPLRNEFHPQVAAQIKGRYYESISCLTNFNCPTDQVVTAPFVSGNTLASNSIATQGEVRINQTTLFSAPTVTLKPGFSAPQGQNFTATTTGCDGVFMRDGSCNAPYSITCGQPFSKNTANGSNNWETYGDETDYTGNEVIHTITLPDFAQISITLSGLTADLDMFLVLDCINGTPVASNIQENTIDEVVKLSNFSDSPQTYYLIVDGFQGATSAYQLTCQILGTCEIPVPVTCGETFQGTTWLGESIWDQYNEAIVREGPEIIHIFQQPANNSTTITLTALDANTNLDLIVLEDCDDGILVNSGTTNGNESITITNSTNAAITRYIAVDGESVVENGEDVAERGAYTLTLACSNNLTHPTINQIGSNQKVSEVTTNLSIQPNPASQYISIQYVLANAEMAQMDLYHANGKRISTLFPKNKQNAGLHQFNFNTTALEEGIYYLVLTTNEISVAEKLVLIQ